MIQCAYRTNFTLPLDVSSERSLKVLQLASRARTVAALRIAQSTPFHRPSRCASESETTCARLPVWTTASAFLPSGRLPTLGPEHEVARPMHQGGKRLAGPWPQGAPSRRVGEHSAPSKASERFRVRGELRSRAQELPLELGQLAGTEPVEQRTEPTRRNQAHTRHPAPQAPVTHEGRGVARRGRRRPASTEPAHRSLNEEIRPGRYEALTTRGGLLSPAAPRAVVHGNSDRDVKGAVLRAPDPVSRRTPVGDRLYGAIRCSP